MSSAFVSFQAIYAGEYLLQFADAGLHILTRRLAALCAETKERQEVILKILRTVLGISRFPSLSILDELVNVWNGGAGR